MNHLLEDDPVLTGCKGLAMTHPDILALSTQPLYLAAVAPHPDRRVALVSGGGSGHEPLHTGLLGRGGLDAVAPGQIFASPHNRQILAASLQVARDEGVLLVVKNYTGDRINFGIAAERLHSRGIPVDTVLVDDDIATTDSPVGRRGTAATVVVEKLLGAAADRGHGLGDLAALGRSVVSHSRSIAVCNRAHTSPTSLHSAWTVPGGHVDYGVGIHGERAAQTIANPPVENLVRRMLGDLLTDLPHRRHGLLLVVNSLGGSSPLEVQAIASLAAEQLAARGETVAAVLTGTHASALDMGGFSLTLTAVADSEWLNLWQAPTHTPLTSWPHGAEAPLLIEPASPDRLPLPNRIPGSRAALDRYAEIVARVHDDLGALDQAVGDGDFGDNLWTGLRKTVARVDTTHEDGWSAAAQVFLDEVGGTSGPLYGLLFQHLGHATAAYPDDQRPALKALSKALNDAAAAIRSIGMAAPGDRVLGTPDPGAIGAALLLTALADVHEPHVAIHPRLRLDRGGGGHMRHQPAVAPSCTPHAKTRDTKGRATGVLWPAPSYGYAIPKWQRLSEPSR